MPTVKESVLTLTLADGKAMSLRRLFAVFSAQARKSYRYSATKLAGNEGNTLLARPADEIVTVDCASLADAFVELVNDATESKGAERVSVSWAHGFATAANSRCFDPSVVGNIREPGRDWADTGRSVFNEHYFVKTPNDTWWYFDPCMFTTYSQPDEAISWRFDSGGGWFSSSVKFIVGDNSKVLLRVPPADAAPKPRGFNSGFVIFASKDFKSDEFAALKGKLANPGWSDSKYQGQRDAALARMNKLLQDKAGVTAPHLPPA